MIVAGAVSPHAHHHQRRLERSLGHPAGGETVHLITVPHTTDKQSMGDFAEENLLRVGVETHVLNQCSRNLGIRTLHRIR